MALQDRFDVTVLTPGRQARLRRSSLPAPLHMTGALARYGLLSPAERLKVGRAALALRFADPATRGSMASGSVTGWAHAGRASMPAAGSGTCSSSRP